MERRDPTHRLQDDRALCGERQGLASTSDASVDCPTCLALLDLAARHRRALVRRSMILIGKIGLA
jgi:hypothetical protein